MSKGQVVIVATSNKHSRRYDTPTHNLSPGMRINFTGRLAKSYSKLKYEALVK